MAQQPKTVQKQQVNPVKKGSRLPKPLRNNPLLETLKAMQGHKFCCKFKHLDVLTRPDAYYFY